MATSRDLIGGSKILTSTRLTHWLKIQSVAGVTVSFAVFVFFMLVVLFGETNEDAWVAMWYAYFVGLPLYGILYVALKLREYLRVIEVALARQET
jgi:type IV secretory pathway VirB3-like protein